MSTFNRLSARDLIAGAVVVAGLTLGCDKSAAVTTPSSLLGQADHLAVTSVAPVAARSGSTVRILGAGFGASTTVTMGGVVARILSPVNFSTIDVIAPDHDGGSVDVVVTNPGGRSVTLTGAFRFTTVTISVSANEVTAGSELTVSWIVPDQGESSTVRGAEDAILLWNINAGKFAWGEETTGTSSGTRTLNAPNEPGQYEFQYKDFNELRRPYDRVMGRSSVITVTAAGQSNSRTSRR
jgi:hypothetical protein